VQAYLLITSETGSFEALVQSVRTIPGVLNSSGLAGPYDVIVHCAAQSMSELRDCIVDEVRKFPETARILTCVVKE
jgi:DNA-binding Lrp family transcriptional regulator